MTEPSGPITADREPDALLQPGRDDAKEAAPQPEMEGQAGAPPKTDETADSGISAEEDEPILGAADLAERIGLRRRMRLAGLESLSGTWFGGATGFGGPTSFGGPAAARDVIIHVHGAAVDQPTIPETGPIGGELLHRIRLVHVAGASHSSAEQVLRKHRLVILQGPDRSGKRTSALFMLSELTGDDVHAISARHLLEAGAGRDLKEHAGYLAESLASEELTYMRLTGLSAQLAEKEAFLVITAPPETAVDANTREYLVVNHQTPDYRQVLRKHLHLDDEHGREAEKLLHIHAPSFVGSPGAAAELAARLLAIARDGRSVNDLGPLLAELRRKQAQHLLRDGQVKEPRERVMLLCRRAALVSTAVFTGLPHADAVAAAEALASRFIAIEFPEPKPKGREVFISWREQLLSEADITIEESELPGRWGPTPAPRLRFRDPELHVALLEEVWEHYDAARSSMLRWLHGLAVGSPDEAVRVRAAQVTGMLATRDFNHVCHHLFLEWAGSINVKAREAAATGLEAVAASLAPPVWDLLAEWCRDGNWHRQQTAILALGTEIGEHNPSETLDRLRQLALRNAGRQAQTIGEAVRRSVTELFSGPHRAVVVAALRAWVEHVSPRLRAVARRCVPPLAHVADDHGRPMLLAALADQTARRADAVLLLTEAVQDPATRQETWAALEKLTVAASTDPELIDTLGTLLVDLRGASDIAAAQLAFYLRLWAHRHPELTSGLRPREAHRVRK
jgi:hypothetical protein